MSYFWDRYESLCTEYKSTPNAIAKELGLSSGSVTSWKQGRIPSGETLKLISEFFNVSIDSLIDPNKTDFSALKILDAFKSFNSIPQRITSLRHGPKLKDDEIYRIAKFTNCSLDFLCGSDNIEYIPVSDDISYAINNLDVLELILGIFDRCPDSEELRLKQIQLSRIVMYWLKQKGYGMENLIKEPFFFSIHKLEFLYGTKDNLDPTGKYGFNFSELDILRELIKTSFFYLFTGKEITIISEQMAQKDREITELKVKLYDFERKSTK